MLNISLRSYFLKLCHWTNIEGYVIIIFLRFTKILLPCSCDYFYLVIAKIKIIHFWICLQASNNCQHAPEYIFQMGFFFLKYFQDSFQVKKVIIRTLNEWRWFLSQCGLPAWELYSSWREEKWGRVAHAVIAFHQLLSASRLHEPLVVGFLNGSTTTMKSEVLNPVYSATFRPVSLLFF